MYILSLSFEGSKNPRANALCLFEPETGAVIVKFVGSVSATETCNIRFSEYCLSDLDLLSRESF